MAFRTYVPHLRTLLRGLHFYCTRYQARMNEYLTAPQVTCLTSLIGTLADCIDIFGEPPINP